MPMAGGQTVHIGSESVNTLAMMLDAIDLLAELAQRHTDKINTSQTKTALHRTRLRVLDRDNFSVLFFCKPDCQRAPRLAACGKNRTEKIEKNSTVFQFSGSRKDPPKNLICCLERYFKLYVK